MKIAKWDEIDICDCVRYNFALTLYRINKINAYHAEVSGFLGGKWVKQVGLGIEKASFDRGNIVLVRKASKLERALL